MKIDAAHLPRASSFIVRPSSFRRACPERSRRAFTLVELMISIALVLLLVLGINQVFKLTGQTIGSGQIINAQQRDMRAAAKQMADDFAAAVSNGPCFIIGSTVQPAFRNANDANTDADYLSLLSSGNLTGNPTTSMQTSIDRTALTIDLNNNGIEGETTVVGENPSLFIPNGRLHRVDQLAFFARGSFHRQTGDPGTFVSATSSAEAFINYGHLSLASDTLNTNSTSVGSENDYFYYEPGQILPSPNNVPLPQWNKNTNNLYASQWSLGRSQILLKSKVSDTYAYRPTSYNSATGYLRNQAMYPNFGTVPVVSLSPLVYQSTAQNSTLSAAITDPGIPTGTQAYYTAWSNRFDIAETSIDQFSSTMAAYFRYNPPAASYPYYNFPNNWYGPLGMLYRFRANPFVTKPQTSRSTALATPALLNSCTQFIVEFAGDFVTQDNDPTHIPGNPGYGTSFHTLYGDVISPQPDGVVDFVVLNLSVAPIRQTRWYGLPRDTARTDFTRPASARGASADADSAIPGAGNNNVKGNNDMPDVVPLRDVLQKMRDPASGATTTANSTLENFWPAGFQPVKADYALYPSGNASLPASQTYDFLTVRPQYWAAWQLGQYSVIQNGVTTRYTNPPKMIRILITLDDPAGHLPDGQTFEFTYNLK